MKKRKTKTYTFAQRSRLIQASVKTQLLEHCAKAEKLRRKLDTELCDIWSLANILEDKR